MTKRYFGLDAARAFLAWIVVVVHCAYDGGIHNKSWAMAGIWAVAAFVTISGFVIASLLLSKKETYPVFVFRRFMRLFPVYVVCLLLALLLQPVAPNFPLSSEVTGLENERFWALLLSHLALLHGIWPHAAIGQCAFLNPAWSISLEWQLYLVAPALLALMLRYRAKLLAPLLAVTLTIAFANIANLIKWNCGFILMRLGFFVIGMTVALYLDRLPSGWLSIRWPRWMTWLGEISYSTYLVHWPLLRLLAHNLPAEWSRLERTLYLTVAGPPLIVLASFGLHELIEKPGIRLGKIICSKLQQARQRRDRLVDLADL